MKRVLVLLAALAACNQRPPASDVITVAVVSFVLTLLATLYPSYRASRINPAEALRYE